MLKSKPLKNHRNNGQYDKLLTIGKASKDLIDDLYNPIDSANRFINLALNSIDENSQGRQFLLESKQGIRKTSILLERLNNNYKKIEKEIREISRRSNGGPRTDSK